MQQALGIPQHYARRSKQRLQQRLRLVVRFAAIPILALWGTAASGLMPATGDYFTVLSIGLFAGFMVWAIYLIALKLD